jgi:hypothetical protein
MRMRVFLVARFAAKGRQVFELIISIITKGSSLKKHAWTVGYARFAV